MAVRGRRPFDYFAFTALGPCALQQTAPNQITYTQGVDFGVIDQSDPGDVTASVTSVDLQLGLGNTSTSGCEVADFAGFPAGNIALLQRGICLKAENAAGPPGSGAIEAPFVDFYDDRGLASAPTAFDGRSDYGPFIAAGVDIPAGGLFTGAEGIKTAAQAAVYGGTAGSQYDPCYHQACDTFANNNNAVLDLNSDAIAFATLTYSMDTSSVTGP